MMDSASGAEVAAGTRAPTIKKEKKRTRVVRAAGHNFELLSRQTGKTDPPKNRVCNVAYELGNTLGEHSVIGLSSDCVI